LFLLLLLQLGRALIFGRVVRQNLEKQILAVFVLEEQLEEERDFAEGINFLEPKPPGLSCFIILPEAQLRKGYLDK